MIRKAISAPKAEEQAPGARLLINRTMCAMPYMGGAQLRTIRPDDSDEKALERVALSMEIIREVLHGVATREREMEAKLREYEAMIDGLRLLAKKIGLPLQL